MTLDRNTSISAIPKYHNILCFASSVTKTTLAFADSHPIIGSSIDGAMVYITSWDEFVERTVQLYRDSPESTRYCMKYRHCDGKLVLKVTDNKECLKFKTDQAQEAKKMEKLNNIFFTLMARGPDVEMSEITGKEQMEAQATKKGRGRKQ
ncbi:hypothetical protein HRI_002246100 [Hibiscus trionum]|uniref:Signal recognition particle 9 kDa protein n=2 Tax=Hibiscus trionum TaxID=183268 RepID=A0A9W7HYH9_HIBTR|nr:hypothetical protein HRI_002245000 [Hibiscus trionum]GMI85768.1 hypothetical protein HRI_002246100 [Hibiscus trionum]